MTAAPHLRVAVVDDDTTMLAMLNELLSEEGFIVTAFTDGQQLMKAAYQDRFDIVMSDINMPQVSGIELLRYLRQIGSKAEVIIMTANAQVDTAIEAVRLGAFDYLKKPFEDISGVVKLVQKAADKILSGRREQSLVQSVIEKTKQLLSFQQKGNTQTQDLEALLARTESMVKGLQESESGHRQLVGVIQEIGLPNLMQMLGIVGKSGILHLLGDGWDGEMWFSSGHIIHAKMGRVKGAKAIFRMLDKETGNFHFEMREAPPPESEIQGSTEGLLLDCLRQMDEYRKLGKRIPPPHLCLRLEKPATPQTMKDCAPEDQVVLEMILRYSRVGEVLDYSPRSDLETVQSLIRLRLAGLLDIYYSA